MVPGPEQELTVRQVLDRMDSSDSQIKILRVFLAGLPADQVVNEDLLETETKLSSAAIQFILQTLTEIAQG